MAKQAFEQLRTDLRDIGFRPKRFGFVLKPVRWLLWPFIRPFHHFLLQKNVEAFERSDQLTHRIDQLTARIDQLYEESLKQVLAQSSLHSDVAAVVNRYVWAEQEIDQLRDGQKGVSCRLDELCGEIAALVNSGGRFEQEIDQLRDGQKGVGCRLDELCGEIAALVNSGGRFEQELDSLRDGQKGVTCHLDELSKFQHAVKGRVAMLDTRTQLSLTSAVYGVFLLKCGDFISDYIAENHTWDEHIVDIVKEVANVRTGTAVDVGAHIGLLTAAMARRFPRVISFEPNVFNYRLLVANMALNRLNHVECVKGALFSRCVELSLGKSDQQEIPLPLTAEGRFDGLAASNLGAYTFTKHGSGVFPTFARTLDSYNLEGVAFIKIDTQGADGEVINGAVETIRRCRPVIVFEWECELSKNYATSLESVRELLQGMNYAVSVLKSHNQRQVDYIARPVA